MTDLRRSTYYAVLFIFLATQAIAGGPWNIDPNGSGQPQRIENWTVIWKADPGRFSTKYSNQDALSNPINPDAPENLEKGWIIPLFRKWQEAKLRVTRNEIVSTVSLTFIYQGLLEEDVTAENYKRYWCTPLENPEKCLNLPYSLVLFDADGEMMRDLGFDPDRIVGLGRPLRADANGLSYKNAAIILNGKRLDKGDIDPRGFKAVILHEIGHMLNLDHAQVNPETEHRVRYDPKDPADQGREIPTMFAELRSPYQLSLHTDDRVVISMLYPRKEFSEKFCTITGEILDREDQGMQGVNVVARNVNDPLEARSMVSGVLYPLCTTNGEYFLHGIMAGEDYRVTYEPIKLVSHDPASGLEPWGANLPKDLEDFEPGLVPSKEGGETVRCTKGGELIRMPAVKMANRMSSMCRMEGKSVTPLDRPKEEVKKSGCSLIR